MSLQSRKVVLGFGALAIVVACNPPPVDPDATFTISATLIDASGTAAADTPVEIFKVDTIWQLEDNFLQYWDPRAGVVPQKVYTTTTNGSGAFQIELTGAEVNTEGGGGAAWLSVLYHDKDNPLTSPATASNWHAFRNEDPDWNAGQLRHWNGGAATQSGSTIDFDWTADSAPSGSVRAAGLPSYMFSYNAGDSDLQWAGFTTSTSLSAPRVAYEDLASPPEYFLTGFSNPTGDSRTYQHRTALKSVNSWMSSSGRARLVISEMYESDAMTGSEFTNTNATDNDLVNQYFFGQSVTNFIIDLGSTQTFSDVLLYNLTLRGFSNAEVSAFVSTDCVDFSTPYGGTNFRGDSEFENWVYLAMGTQTARCINITVDKQGNTGIQPFFNGVGEVRVFQ